MASEIDTQPLLRVLRSVRDAGRAAKGRGASFDDDLVSLAYRCHAVLMWLEADEAGDLEAARRWLVIADAS